jgi:hypothetical protein
MVGEPRAEARPGAAGVHASLLAVDRGRDKALRVGEAAIMMCQQAQFRQQQQQQRGQGRMTQPEGAATARMDVPTGWWPTWLLPSLSSTVEILLSNGAASSPATHWLLCGGC